MHTRTYMHLEHKGFNVVAAAEEHFFEEASSRIRKQRDYVVQR